VIKAQPKADQPQPINLGLIRPLADSAEKVKIKKAKTEEGRKQAIGNGH